jgi:aldehyde dehydrogenase (NAD+)
MKEYNHIYIDGAWVAPHGDGRSELVNPATEEVFARISLGNAADVDRAVAAARRAATGFAATSREERIALIERIIDGIEARRGDLMAALTEEMGAPVSLGQQVTAGILSFKQAIATLKEFEFERQEAGYLIRHESIGVAGLITPWNWPLQMICNKLSSAFAAGCPVVVKPSEITSASAIILAEVIHDAGVAPGMFNLVIGSGRDVGDRIAAHEDIDVVSFTGSTRAGGQVAAAAAASIKRVTQELGGKSANIILPDADLASAAEYNVTRGFSNSGQSCHSPTRLLVHESQLEEILVLLKDAVARNVRIGDPTDPATKHGPVVSRAQFNSIQSYIESGIEEGARLVCGGTGRPDGIERGFFMKPTIFADVTPDMKIAREEIFGMVTAVLAYRTVDEAIAMANDSDYGLGAYVFGTDKVEVLNVGRQMRAGRVFLNGAPPSTAAPMGGYRKSGNGREMGVWGMEEYLETKALLGAS